MGLLLKGCREVGGCVLGKILQTLFVQGIVAQVPILKNDLEYLGKKFCISTFTETQVASVSLNTLLLLLVI